MNFFDAAAPAVLALWEGGASYGADFYIWLIVPQTDKLLPYAFFTWQSASKSDIKSSDWSILSRVALMASRASAIRSSGSGPGF